MFGILSGVVSNITYIILVIFGVIKQAKNFPEKQLLIGINTRSSCANKGCSGSGARGLFEADMRLVLGVKRDLNSSLRGCVHVARKILRQKFF